MSDEQERQEQLMRREKRARLENKGWRFGSVREFLVLSTAEAASVEDRLQSMVGVGRRRRAKKSMPRVGARRSAGAGDGDR
jgi:hypothetical protein